MDYNTIIQKYIKNELQGDELIYFEKELASNPELADEVAFTRQFKEVAKWDDWLNMYDTFDSVVKNTTIIPTPKTQWWRTRQFAWLSLAGLISLSVVFFLMWQNRQAKLKEKAEAITAKYWKFDNIVNVDSFSSSSFAKGIIYYKKGEFSLAIAPLEKYLKELSLRNPPAQDEEINLTKLYLSASYAFSGQEVKAIKELKPLAESVGSDVNTAQWLLGLSYLHQGDISNAKKWFNPLQNDAVWGDNVRDVLQKVDFIEIK